MKSNRRKDRRGDKWNMLRALEPMEDSYTSSGKIVQRYLFECDCGNRKELGLRTVRKGHTKSCGCLKGGGNTLIDIVEENVYGELTIIREVEPYVSPRGEESRKVLCRCSCGNDKEYVLNYLRQGDAKSKNCGCIPIKKPTKIQPLDIKKANEKPIGDWIITREVESYRKEKDNSIVRIVEAVCRCGLKKEANINNVRESNSCYECAMEERRMPEEDRVISRVLTGMKARCNNKGAHAYDNYGGRGIRVCEEWGQSKEKFIEWARENGYKEGLEIDRIDNDGNYEPGNCRFVTKATNSRNRRTNVMNWDIVEDIREGRYDHMSNEKLASKFECSEGTIRRVKMYDTWKKRLVWD